MHLLSKISILFLAWALVGGCRRGVTRIDAEEALLRRQLDGLRALNAAAEQGHLVDVERILVVVDEHLVQDVLQAATPFEHTLGELQIRVDSAAVSFADGFALVRLDGRAALVGRDAYAQVSVYGSLEVEGLDPASGVLRAGFKVFSVEAPKVNVLGVDEPAREVVAALGRQTLEDYGKILSAIEIPVRVEGNVAIPATKTERIQIEAASVPVRASLLEVRVFSGRLWIVIRARVGVDAREPMTASR